MKWSESRTVFPLLGTALLLPVLVSLAVAPALANRRTSARAAALVKTSSAHILVTPKGRTLYVFALDKKNKSSCNGTCAKFWPPLQVPKGTTPPTKLSGVPGTFGEATRTDGTKQLTYRGAPLYIYSGDAKAGDMNGQGIILNGGFWWVVVAGGK
jgi:predicted lipoprotein with Yx(FWY)xxD motif